MNNTSGRPKIKLKLTTGDKILEAAAIILLLILWETTLSRYSNLPDSIPIHFNSAGKVDEHGSKQSILFIPVIATIIYFGMTILSGMPHILNYPSTITAENAERQYRRGTKLLRLVKLIVMIVFLAVVISTYKVVEGKSTGPGRWFVPVVVAAFVTPVVYYLATLRRKNK
jgi:uncharacterized membrane protein